MAQYSLFALKVPLNPNQLTNRYDSAALVACCLMCAFSGIGETGKL